MDNIANNTLKGKRIEDASTGAYGAGYVNIAANVVEAETVVISGDTYEFIDAGTVTAGNIEVSVTGDLTPANATDALIAAINANSKSAVLATDIDANTVLITTLKVGSWVAMSETMTGGGNTVDAMANWQDRKLALLGVYKVVPSAAEVTKGSIVVALDFTPVQVDVAVVVTTTRAAKAWDGAVTYDLVNNLVTIDNGGAVDWAATDTVLAKIYG